LPGTAQPLVAFLFLSPWAALATGLGAISIPIIIHLFSRRRFRIVDWAAMRFLLAAQKQNVRRMRLEQLLLLAVRVLLLLLLVLAMASVAPWAEAVWHKLFPDSAVMAAVHRRTHKVIVLDGSFSMGLKIGDRNCFELARARALQILETTPGGDGFSVVLMAAPVQRIVPEPSEDGPRVADEIRKLRLPHGNADLTGTLLAVDEMLGRSPGKFEAREVYFVTDMQRSTWIRPAPDAAKIMQRLQERARLVFVDVGGGEAPGNLAVTDLRLINPLATTATVTPISATIHKFGADDGKPVRVELLIGKSRSAANDPPFDPRVVGQQTVRVPPGQAGATVSFAHKFSTPGAYVLQVRIENDALDLDDSRSLVVTVKDTLPVMLVNGKPAAEEYERATGYLRDALQPSENRAGLAESPVRVKVISETQFGDATLGDLTGYDCVFLCDVARFSAAEVRRLETHLKRGGGAIFCLGPRVDLEAYNRLLFKNGEGILPARLLGIHRATEERPFLLFADEDSLKVPPMAAFAGQYRVSLLEPRFTQYVRTELPTAKPRGRKVALFRPEPQISGVAPANKNDGPPLLPVFEPAIIEAPYQRGRVVLITTTANKDWNNWADRPSLLAMMHEILHFAVGGRMQGHAVLVGDPLEEFLPSGTSGLEVTLHTPDGRAIRKVTEANEDSAFFRFAETEQAGIYRATIGQHPQDYLYAVNVPTSTEGQQGSESDLTRLQPQDLQASYAGMEFQVVHDPRSVVHAPAGGTGDGQPAGSGMGPVIARVLLFLFLVLMLGEVVLAWKLGRFSKTGVPAQVQTADGKLLPSVIGGVAAVAFVVVAGVLIHTAWTGDFLGFLPENWRSVAESAFGVAKPVAGESTRWRLESTPYLPGRSPLEPWLVGTLALAAGVLVLGIYLREGQTAGAGYRVLLAGLRFFLILLTLLVLLPQLQLWFERQGWPDIAIIIDDSGSMSVTDAYQDTAVKEAADRLARATGLSKPQRLQLAQALLTRKDADWIEDLLTRRKVKVHLYHCSTDAIPLAEAAQPDQRDVALEAIKGLHTKADTKDGSDGSLLGKAVRTVLNRRRGQSLSAIIMLTDGVTTEGEDLVQASQHAAQMGVPLYFVGIGDNHEVRDLILHDLQVEDTVFVGDRLVFEARLTAQGYTNLRAVEVKLREKTADGQFKDLETQKVIPDPQGKPVKFRMTHRPTEPGERTYIIEAETLPDEPQPPDNNRLERTVLVREAKPSKVLYIEGPFRYEFRYIKSLLEREGADAKGNKTVDLKVLVLDADPEYPAQDKSALADFPTKEELNQYDVVILGDVDPKDPRIGDKNLKLLVDFVRERGGGLLVIAGELFCPQAYKDTPLADVLPIQVTGGEAEPRDVIRREGFRPELTPVGRLHPMFRFHPDEQENQALWSKLAEMKWFAEGYRLQPAAEVLAVHPRRRAAVPRFGGAGDDKHPLVVQHFVGAGRCMFFGFDETWRWRFREDELHFNQFWTQTVKYLARSGVAGIQIRLNRSTPYRRGEPIQITVRFPDDAPAPAADTPVKVVVERRTQRPGAETETEIETLQLAKLEGSRATYETIKTRTPKGDYRMWLSAPAVVGAKPRAECRVLDPPGEMEKIRMNQVDMQRAAEQSRGKFYTLADADRLLDDLPAGSRIALHTPGPPWLLWNHFGMLFLLLGVFGGEWILRKRKHLL
jgi:hypothetical protein